MSLIEWSSFQWSINSENQSQNISVKLDSWSTWTLTSDSYVSEILSNAEWYSNINLNGYTLYIWETAVTSVDQIQTSELWSILVQSEDTEISTNNSSTGLIICWIWILVVAVIVWICIKKYLKSNKK